MPAFANGHTHQENSQSTTPFTDHQPAAQHGFPRALSAAANSRFLIGPDYGTNYSSVVLAAQLPAVSGFERMCVTGSSVAAAQGSASDWKEDIDPSRHMYHGIQPGTPNSDVADLSFKDSPSSQTSLVMGSFANMSSFNDGRQLDVVSPFFLAHLSGPKEKCPIQTCECLVKGFARKYDHNRHHFTAKYDRLWHECPAGLADLSPAVMETPRDTWIARSEVVAAYLTAHIACLQALLSELSKSVLLMHDTDQQQLSRSLFGQGVVLNTPV